MRKVPSWDQYFMSIAETVATRSKDPNTQVGSCVVKNGKIVGTGYNGMAPGFPETATDWERPAKYKLVIHSENNAIIHSTTSLEGATLYVTLSPCQECAKIIVSAGIKKVFYKATREELQEALVFLHKCGVKTEELNCEV
jgi:dCMP deaminase